MKKEEDLALYIGERTRMERTLRKLFDAAERIIRVLDALDGDSDLEPSLGHHPVGVPPWFVDIEGTPPLAPRRSKRKKITRH